MEPFLLALLVERLMLSPSILISSKIDGQVMWFPRGVSTMHLYVVECNKGAQSFCENVSQMLAMVPVALR